MRTCDLTQLRILVIDDEMFVLNLTVRLLEKHGFSDIESAQGGEAGLAIVQSSSRPFDVIICDLNMPGMNGVELARELSVAGFTGGVIFLSGVDNRIVSTASDLARAHNLNVLGTLSKPLQGNAIRGLLESYVPWKQQRSLKSQLPITEQELRSGINGNELQLVYQPKLQLDNGHVHGVETLARWNHAERGLLGPGDFVPLAEQCGLIDDLTIAVYKKALAQLRDWHRNGYSALTVAINVSINTFSTHGFSQLIMNSARQAGVDPDFIALEVTESQVMDDALNCLEILMRLRLSEFGLSIDDFGTGHSSLSQLKRIPFSELKIDRAFVYGATQDKTARAILESSIGLAKKLGLSVVAEGVETQDELDLVARLGCNYVQGYFIAKPMTADEFELWMKIQGATTGTARQAGHA